jgi:hypothetical protein
MMFLVWLFSIKWNKGKIWPNPNNKYALATILAKTMPMLAP